MPARLIREDIEQRTINFRQPAITTGFRDRRGRHQLGRRNGGFAGLRQRLGRGAQPGHIHGRYRPAFEPGNHLRQRVLCALQDVEHGLGRLGLAVTQAIQNAFHGPGMLGDVGGADHAAAALERVIAATHLGQRLAVVGVRAPTREFARHVLQHIARVLDEDRHDLLVEFLRQRRRLRGGGRGGWHRDRRHGRGGDTHAGKLGERVERLFKRGGNVGGRRRPDRHQLQ